MYLNFFKRASTSSDTVTERPATKVEEDKDAAAAAAEDLRGTIYDIIRTIKDPEKAATLEDLNVVYEDGVRVLPPFSVSNTPHVKIEFNPTVPHCSLATMIGLCIRVKIQRCLPKYVKLEIYIKKGSHDIEDEVNKQINDKERIAAAMENPSLKELVEGCIKEEE